MFNFLVWYEGAISVVFSVRLGDSLQRYKAADLSSDVTQRPPSQIVHCGISSGTITALSPQPIILWSCVSVMPFAAVTLFSYLLLFHSVSLHQKPTSTSHSLHPLFICVFFFFFLSILCYSQWRSAIFIFHCCIYSVAQLMTYTL